MEALGGYSAKQNECRCKSVRAHMPCSRWHVLPLLQRPFTRMQKDPGNGPAV